MVWTVKIGSVAEKQLHKLDVSTRNRLLDYLWTRVEGCENPRFFGEPLKGDKSGLWRYRVGNYRLLCEIQDTHLIVLVIAVGHRRDIYENTL